MHLEALGALPLSQIEAALPCLPFPPSAAWVDGDAAPGRRAEEHEHERDDGGDQKKMGK